MYISFVILADILLPFSSWRNILELKLFQLSIYPSTFHNILKSFLNIWRHFSLHICKRWWQPLYLILIDVKKRNRIRNPLSSFCFNPIFSYYSPDWQTYYTLQLISEIHENKLMLTDLFWEFRIVGGKLGFQHFVQILLN